MSDSYPPSGRLGVVARMSRTEKFSISIGCKSTRLADINVDIDPSNEPDLICDATVLQFKERSFELVLLTDVIEHLQRNSEIRALKEIRRIMVPSGDLILTTPNNVVPYTYLDPAFYIVGHRHYDKKEIKKLVELAGFEIKMIATRGGVWECLSVIWYLFVEYPINSIKKNGRHSSPTWIENRVNSEYQRESENGYTIFLLATPRGQ